MQLLNSCQEDPQRLCPLLGHISRNARQVLEGNFTKLPNLHSNRNSNCNSNNCTNSGNSNSSCNSNSYNAI